MFLKFCFLLIIAAGCKEIVTAKNYGRNEARQTSDLYNGNFDYETGIEPRIFMLNRSRPKSNPATPAPLISYWQNFVRNVRLPMPSFSWNVTNPLAPLFNVVGDQPVEIPPSNTQHYHNNANRLRVKPKRKRKDGNKKKGHRKNKKPMQNTDKPQIVDTTPHEQLLHQYINSADPNAAIYFYDPNSDAYYTVQRVQPPNSLKEGFQNHIQQPIATTESLRAEIQFEDLNSKLEKNQNDESEEYINASTDEIHDEPVDGTHLDNADEVVETQLPTSEKPKEQEQKIIPSLSEETLRSVLNGYMINDQYNRIRQRTKDHRKGITTYKQKPRSDLKYYFVLKG